MCNTASKCGEAIGQQFSVGTEAIQFRHSTRGHIRLAEITDLARIEVMLSGSRNGTELRRQIAYSAGLRRVLVSLLGMLALSLAGAYSAHAQKIIDGLVKPPVIDKHDIRFTRLAVNGEPLQSWISDIVQDNYGFLWFGTLDGLYKYDGYSLKAYRHERGNPNSVADDSIRALYKDRDGSIWIGTGYGGLDRLDPNRDNFTHYPHKSHSPESLLNNNVVCVYRDRGGQLWVGTNGGLDRLEPASGTFVHYRHDPRDAGSLSNNIVTSVYEDRRGNLWVGTEMGLNKLERTTGRFSRFLHDPANPHSIGHDYVVSILEDRSGVLWVASPIGSGLSALDAKTGDVHTLLLSRGGTIQPKRARG